ncbi:MAG: HemK2/MTQ2 family protein methyltransferase [Promethearchaeota archaeon]
MKIPSIPDPIINCDFEDVYAPSDDTFLILDYFKSNITKSFFDGIEINKIQNILDLGTGTGIFAIFFELIKIQYPNFNPKIYASDILEVAIKCAELNQKANNINDKIIFLHSNLFDSFPDKLRNTFDIIVFNPPYLPSLQLIKEKAINEKIDYSWDGGLKGYEILIDFLKDVVTYLNLRKEHYIYCITSSRTNLTELNEKVTRLGYKNEIVRRKHIFFEDILLNRLRYNLD